MIKPYQYISESKESGNAWSSIAEDLNKISEVHFDVNQIGVRDQCCNFAQKTKQKSLEEMKGNLAPVRKMLNLIVYWKKLEKNGMKLLYHVMIN